MLPSLPLILATKVHSFNSCKSCFSLLHPLHLLSASIHPHHFNNPVYLSLRQYKLEKLISFSRIDRWVSFHISKSEEKKLDLEEASTWLKGRVLD